MVKKIGLLFIVLFCSQFSKVFCQELSSFDDIYNQIKPFASFDKNTYDQAKAIELIEGYITKNGEVLSKFDKIRILVLAGDLFSLHAKPKQRDYAKSYSYYQKACEVGSTQFTIDKLRCMSYLVDDSKTKEEKVKKLIALNYLLAWLLIQTESEVEKWILLPPNTENTKELIQKFLSHVEASYESTSERILDMSIENQECEKLITKFYKPCIDWVTRKYNIKIVPEEKKAPTQNITKDDEVKAPKITPFQNYQVLDKLRYKELLKENIESIARFLDDENKLDPKSFQMTNADWLLEVRVCDYAVVALEHIVNGNGYAWNRLKYNLKNKDKKLEEWRAWWKVAKNMSLEDIGRKTIEQAFSQPISKENQFYASSVLYSWVGWGFEMRNRVSLKDEKPESIIQEAKSWWDTQKDKDIASWKKSALELKETPKYVKIKENLEVARKTKSDSFNAKRKGEFEKFQKESPELLEFIRTLDKLEYTPEGIKKALETIKINKPKLKGTTFEEELEEFEQKLLADPSLIEK